ncbi:MAG TPA: SURF1 family cytochrome oxidase biogenesis protein [Xanthobacteraceae bacterium]|nr:SURF1 family cytochrome oxidase biogenesis protein [Xanthobacteraceae bacterium]
MTAAAGRLRRVAGLTVFSVVIVALLIGLGVWQLQRRVEKHALITMLDERLAAAPVPLPAMSAWPKLSPVRDEFRRVTLSASFETRPDAHVFSSGSAVRSDITSPGVWVFAPARVEGAGVVVINRGFVPEGQLARMSASPGGVVALTGYLRFPETPGLWTPQADVAKRLWFIRDPQAMAQALNWGEIAPFYIDLEAPVPTGGLPKPGPLTVHLKDDHLQYAITWFGLAAAVAIAFLAWLRRALTEARLPPEEHSAGRR